jgi:hypothetical protein
MHDHEFHKFPNREQMEHFLALGNTPLADLHDFFRGKFVRNNTK